MGTRGCFGVRVNGEDKLTYNHFDSYPSGLGVDLVEQIKELREIKHPLDAPYGIVKDWLEDHGQQKDVETLVDFIRKAIKLRPIDEGKKPTKEEKKALAPYTDLKVSEGTTDDWYCLTRKLQGNLVDLLNCGLYVHNNDFMRDSLFCEWAYIVNLDDMTFEIYRGFQKEPHDKGRFANLEAGNEVNGKIYYPVALAAVFPISNIPENWATQVVEDE